MSVVSHPPAHTASSMINSRYVALGRRRPASGWPRGRRRFDEEAFSGQDRSQFSRQLDRPYGGLSSRHAADDDVGEAQLSERSQLLGDGLRIAVGDRPALQAPVASVHERAAHSLSLGPVLGDEHVLADRYAGGMDVMTGARFPL